jgi:hypothetical protein
MGRKLLPVAKPQLPASFGVTLFNGPATLQRAE